MNPAVLNGYSEFTWEDYMEITSVMQVTCDAVYFLPDWYKSRGAIAEYYKSEVLGQKKFFDLKAIPKK